MEQGSAITLRLPMWCEYTHNQHLKSATNSDVQLLLAKMTANNLLLYDEQVVRFCSSTFVSFQIEALELCLQKEYFAAFFQSLVSIRAGYLAGNRLLAYKRSLIFLEEICVRYI